MKITSLVKTTMFAAALLIGVATEALAAGSISGRVTGSNAPSGLQGTIVLFIDLLHGHGDFPLRATTDASGN